MKFTERTPIEQGFSAVFDADVAPQMMEFEFERQAMLKKTYLHMVLAVVAAVAIIGLAYAIWGDRYFIPAILLSAMGGGVAVFSIWSGAGSKWGSKIKDVAMPAICTHVGDLEFSQGGSAFSLSVMSDMKLLPKYDNAALRSLLTGTHNGTTFEMVHANLTIKYQDNDNRNRTETVFQGLLFRIELANSAPGRIALMRDRGGIGNKLAETFAFGSTRSLPKITFDHAAFEAAFEVYGDRPDEAEAFLSAQVREALLQIGHEQGGGRGADSFVAGFSNRSFYMALKRDGSFMSMGSLTTPVADMEGDLHGIFADIALAHRVVDQLQTAFEHSE